ncbi:putative egg cell-secreted protein 1.4-like [Capsicum annuum]|uniref:Uncharacterized protein n=1 Tax=Capsicum annuum TaxID=4072 RepID=A0A2G2Y6Z4_CAPAN|nr:putative B3 domain-containing protein At3g49610 [Capsicum annuum]KAF3673028.1 putative egg cell-secreted protein 1.4-like [Capsicum annuum]PHT65536.1 hypothetical protein T459_29961 [Capsicum annuum]
MVFTMLSLDDFVGMASTPNMTPMDYLLTVSKVAWTKINIQERINHKSIFSSFPIENSTLDFVIPKGKRSMRNTRARKFTEQFFCNSGDSMIKKAVENNSDERVNRVFKMDWDVGVSNQEFFLLEKSTKNHKEKENRVIKINWKGSGNFAFERQFPIIRKKRSRELANEDQKRFKKKAKRNIIVRVKVPPVGLINRELDIDFKKKITEMGGSLVSVKLVIEKRLFDTDVKRAEGRLLIPQRQMINVFLEPEEDSRLNTRSGDNMCEMKVMLIQPSREISKINLRKWFMNKGNGNYVLVTYWNEVVETNDLKIGTKVQLWAFRKGTDLCFALVKHED